MPQDLGQTPPSMHGNIPVCDDMDRRGGLADQLSFFGRRKDHIARIEVPFMAHKGGVASFVHRIGIDGMSFFKPGRPEIRTYLSGGRTRPSKRRQANQCRRQTTKMYPFHLHAHLQKYRLTLRSHDSQSLAIFQRHILRPKIFLFPPRFR